MITKNEVTNGISQEDFDAIAKDTRGFLKRLTVYRQNPSFTLHDHIAGRGYGIPFSVAADSACVVRVINDSGTIKAERLLAENENPTILNSWSTPAVLGTGLYPLEPKVWKNGSTWEAYYVSSNGLVCKVISSNGIDWADAGSVTSTTLPTDVSLEHFTCAINPFVAYVCIKQSNNARRIMALDGNGWYDTDIYWGYTIEGFDVGILKDNSDDPDVSITNSNIRHILAINARTPALFTYKEVVGSTPVRTTIETGGNMAFIIKPPLSGRPIQVSRPHEVQTFDKFYGLQIRQNVSLTNMDSIHSLDPFDTLWMASWGGDGDANDGDTSYGYNALYYYSSRDGKNWTQDKIIPYTDLGISSSDVGAKGVQLAKCGCYVYCLSAISTLRSLGCGEFNNPHPQLKLDVTRRVVDYNSSWTDVRQSSITLDNKDGYFNNTFVVQGGALTLLTEFGGRKSDQEYLYQVAIEEIDALEPSRERPHENLSIQSRDRMAWIMDRVASQDAHQFDNLIVGHDTYDNTVGNIDNTGLAHTASIAGSWGTDNNNLILKSKFKEGVAFSTFKTNVADGQATAYFTIPDPTTYAPSSTETDAPTYAGVIFRGIDKDNYWFARYNYWTNRIELGTKLAGFVTIHKNFYVSSTFRTNAVAGLPIGIRVEFRHNLIRVYECSIYSIKTFAYLGQYIAPGYNYPDAPILQGYTGVIACGFSDGDTAMEEPPPIEIPDVVIPPEVTVWGNEDSAYVPYKWLIGQDRYVLRGNYNKATHTLSVQNANGTGVNWDAIDGGGWYSNISLLQDPWDYKRVIRMGIYGIAITDDITQPTPTWRYATLNWTSSGYPALDPVYAGLQVPIFAHKMCGSINRQGYFCWLMIESSAQQVYRYGYPKDFGGRLWFMYTTDYFATIHKTQIGRAAAGRWSPNDGWWNGFNQNILISCFNTMGNGEIWVIPNRDDSTGIHYSNNWGASFTQLPGTYGTYSGLADLPYSKPGGGENSSNPFGNAMVDVSGLTYGWTNIDLRRGDMSAITIPNNNINYQGATSGAYCFNSYTLDANIRAFLFRSTDFHLAEFYRTINNGASWTRTTVPPGYDWNEPIYAREGINGWPVNPLFYVIWGNGRLYTTFDGGASWNSVGGDYNKSSLWQVVPDLSDMYDEPVTN